jgi:hypothetical protein
MFQQFLFLGTGVLALIAVLGTPGQLHAQRARGGSMGGMNPGFQLRFNPSVRPAFTPGFAFTPNFNGRFVDPRFSPMRLERFEDRFENRFGMGRFDRLEDRLENRFRSRLLIDPSFRPGLRFVPGFGFVPNFGFPPGFVFIPGFGFVPGF